MSGHKSKWPLKQVFDKLGEKPGPSLRQALDPLRPKPDKDDLKQAFDKLGGKPGPSLRQALDPLGENPGPSLRQALDPLRPKPDKDDLRQAFEIDLTPREPPPLPTKPKRTRKKGAGPPPALTDDEIARGREIFRELLRKNPMLRKATRTKQVRQVKKALKLGRQVSDDTYLRHVIRPVVGRKHNKAQ